MNILVCSHLYAFMVQGELQFSVQVFKVQIILALGDLGAQSWATDELGEHISLL